MSKENFVQKIDFNLPTLSINRGGAPLKIKIMFQSQPSYMEGGSMAINTRSESYVLISALPVELRRQVESAIQAIVSGM